MAGIREVRCVGPSYQLADRKAGVQRTVNMYLSHVEGVGEDRQFILRSCPGIGQNIATGNIRGMIAGLDEYVYFVDGAALWQINPDVGISSLTGNTGFVMRTDAGPIRMVLGNGLLVIVDGAYGYVHTIGSGRGVTEISDPDWRGSSQVEFLDGYFIFAAPNSDQFYYSAIDDPTNLDALDFSSADRLPDPIMAIRVLKQQLYIFGPRSTEIWINSGQEDPFVRYNSAPIDVGIVGQQAVIKTTDSLFFVGLTERGQAAVYVMEGNMPRRISKRAVEETLVASGTDLSACNMWTYQTAGAEFVGIEVPGATTTWVYDIASGEWHERRRHNYLTGEMDSMGIIDVATKSGRHVVLYQKRDPTYGQYKTMSLLSDDSNRGAYVSLRGPYDGDYEPLIRERTWPHLINPAAEPVKYASLELMCTTGNGGDANVTLEISNDGGYTWGPPLLRSLGETGQFMQRVRWLLLGQARDRVFRVRCSDNVEFNIHGAQLEAS